MRRALLILALTGCSKILGIGDVTRGDGGTDTMVDMGAPPNTVIGRMVNRHTTASGMTDVPVDLSGSIIRALIPDASQPSGFQTIDGVGKADGTFSISPVPDGVEYYLKINRSIYVTTQHDIDLHFDMTVRGEPAPALATTATPVMFALTNLTPWHSNEVQSFIDYIEVWSFQLLYQGFGAGNVKDAAITWNETFDWFTDGFPHTSLGVPLPDASQGDDIWILHNRALDVGTFRRHRAQRLASVYSPTGITLSSGMSTPVSGAFTTVPTDKTLNVTVSRGQYDSGYEATTQTVAFDVALRATPLPTDFLGVGATLASITFMDWSRSTSGTEFAALMYGDPFPASWSRVSQVQYTRSRYILLPGTITPRSVTGSMFRTTAYSGGAPNVSPTLLPPQGFKLAGKAAGAGGVLAFDGAKPIVATWNPVSGAKSYALTVFRVFANGSQTRTSLNAQIVTAGTSVQIPAEAFSGGEWFTFSVQAQQTPSDFAGGHLVANGVPNQFASTPAGMFRVGSMCGNGAVDTGEQCDTMGETAACDVDCTPVACGDGMRNATAGEVCDSIRDTEGCDSDCSAVECGDGRVNTQVEDCDDGNTADNGNGCSALCKFNNACGDGTLQTLVEQCEGNGADTATCDSDCTLPACPDAHVNAAAGEQCDDGNYDDTDSCTTSCMTN